MAIGYGQPAPKPELRKKSKARKLRLHRTVVHDVRDYVFARERGICRCCRAREAHSMHELRFKSLGGKVSKMNSVAVCGSGTTLCHGLLQRNAITWEGTERGAEDSLLFRPKTDAAAEHMKLKIGEGIVSPPMREMDFDTREMA